VRSPSPHETTPTPGGLALRKPPHYSVIVPAYNEERTLGNVIDTVLALPGELELIVVDDASRDGTAAVIERYRDEPRVVPLHHAVNAGKGAAIRTGLEHARGDWIAIQDADVELDPREIPRSVAFGEERGLDLVLGSRFLGPKREGASQLAVAANWFLTFLVRALFAARISDMETGHKVFRRQVVEGLALRANRFDFEPEFVCRVLARRVRLGERPIGYEPRGYADGKSIGWRDGVDAVRTILKWRLLTWREGPRAAR